MILSEATAKPHENLGTIISGRVTNGINHLVEEYVSGDTFAGRKGGLHSNLSIATHDHIQKGMSPFKALVATMEEHSKRSLNSYEQGILFVKAGTNVLFELGSRKAVSLPLVGTHIEKPLQELSGILYKSVWSW